MELSPHRLTRFGLASLLTAGLLAGVAGVPASAARLAPQAPKASGPYLDPVLLTQLGDAAAVPAIFSWDADATSHEEISAYLDAHSIEATLFSGGAAGFACAASLATVQALADAPGMLSVHGDRALTPALKKSVPTAFNGDPNAVWQGLGVTGEGVGIAVLDTGIDAGHPDLAYGTRVRRNFRVLLAAHDFGNTFDPCPFNYTTYSDDREDTELTSGHGTHIASVAAGDGTASGGKYKGVAPKAYLIGIGVDDTITPRTTDDAGGTRMSMLGAMSAMSWIQNNAVEGPNKVKVVLAGWTMRGIYDKWQNPVSQFIEDLSNSGVTVVVPAGNEGPEQSDCSAPETCDYNLAGVHPAIGVGASPRGSRLVLEEYSSRGDPVTRYWWDAPARFEPTIVAPGSDVVAARRIGLAPFVRVDGSPIAAGGSDRITTDPDYVPLTGTSVAAAHVAGAVALMQQAAVDAKGCYLTVPQVREVLEATATPMQGYQRSDVGAGMIDVTAAVSYARFIPKVDSLDLFMCPEPGQR